MFRNFDPIKMTQIYSEITSAQFQFPRHDQMLVTITYPWHCHCTNSESQMIFSFWSTIMILEAIVWNKTTMTMIIQSVMIQESVHSDMLKWKWCQMHTLFLHKVLQICSFDAIHFGLYSFSTILSCSITKIILFWVLIWSNLPLNHEKSLQFSTPACSWPAIPKADVRKLLIGCCFVTGSLIGWNANLAGKYTRRDFLGKQKLFCAIILNFYASKCQLQWRITHGTKQRKWYT